MNYADLAKTILPDIHKAVDLINNIEVDPEIRRMNLEILFRRIAEMANFVVYDMNAFDMDILETMSPGIDKAYLSLAREVSDSVSVGGKDKVNASIDLWLKDVIAKAQQDAFVTARDLSKHPTVTRIARGKTCEWCKSLVGKYTDPDREVFKRHAFCDCKIVTEGYRGRNGELKNYVKLTPEELSERQRFYGYKSAAARWDK